MHTSRKDVGLSPEELQEAEKQKELARLERKARYRLKKHGVLLVQNAWPALDEKTLSSWL